MGGVAAFANTDGLYWLIPVMTVTILIGLALDYDVFLFARIYEYRVMGGVPTHEAIIRGVYKTGSIITAAGIIMGIAFCGLLLSQITSLNQTRFIMVIANAGHVYHPDIVGAGCAVYRERGEL